MLSNTLLRNRLSQALILFRNSQQVRTFGLLDRLTQFVSRAGAPTSQDAQKAEAFKFQMDFMLDDARSTYTLADHFTLLQKQDLKNYSYDLI